MSEHGKMAKTDEWKNRTNAGTTINGSRKEECRNIHTHLLYMHNKFSLEGHNKLVQARALQEKVLGGQERACAECPNVTGLPIQKNK